MKYRTLSFILAPLLSLLALAAHAADVEFLYGNWKVHEEGSLIVMAEERDLTDTELQEHRSTLIDAIVAKNPKLTIDPEKITLVIGNKLLLMDYEVTEVTPYAVHMKLNLEGEWHEGRIERYSNRLVRLVLGGNYDWYLWTKVNNAPAEGEAAALQQAAKPGTEGELEALFNRMAQLAEQGDFAAILAMHSQTSQNRQAGVEKVASRWSSLSSNLGYGDLVVRQTTQLAREPGVWFVEGRYERGKTRGPIFSIYFKQIDGEWRVVSAPEYE